MRGGHSSLAVVDWLQAALFLSGLLELLSLSHGGPRHATCLHKSFPPTQTPLLCLPAPRVAFRLSIRLGLHMPLSAPYTGCMPELHRIEQLRSTILGKKGAWHSNQERAPATSSHAQAQR